MSIDGTLMPVDPGRSPDPALTAGWAPKPIWQRALRYRNLIVGAVILLLVVLVAVFAPIVAPYGPNVQHLSMRLQPPSATHLLGTDDFGRDILSRELFGLRLSLIIGFLVMLGTSFAGIAFGAIAGFVPAADGPIMRVMDAFMAFPWMVLAIAFVAFLGHSITNVAIVLCIVYTPRMARIVRSVTLVEREKDYIQAARSVGSGTLRTLLRHILPNVLDLVVIQATFTFAYAVLNEALLSFLGVGVPPYIPSLGEMINAGEEYLSRAPWMTIFPGIGIMAVVVGLNLFGDGLRDFLDPHGNR